MLSILVVEDEFYIREGLKTAMDWKSYGLSVKFEAENGLEALDIVKKNNVDIILCDIQMPNMDGIEFISELKKLNKSSKVVVISGHEKFDYAQKAMNCGAVAYLLKPVDKSILLDVVLKVASSIKQERMKEEYYNELDMNLSLVKQQLLRSFFSGEAPSNIIVSEGIPFLKIPQDLPNKVVLVLSINQYRITRDLIGRELLENNKLLLNEFLNKILLQNQNFEGKHIDITSKLIGVIIHLFNFDDVSLSEKAINELVKSITDFTEENLKITLSIGVSKVFEDIAEIPIKYQEALSLTEKPISRVENRVFFARKHENDKVSTEVLKILNFMKNNYNEKISVNDVATELYLSEYYVMHLLKKELGKTFNACLLEFRIEAAKKMLRDFDMKISEIAQNLSFVDVKYFNNLFKREVGINPREYRKMLLEEAHLNIEDNYE